MVVASDLRRQIDQIDREMIELLARRTKLARKILSSLEDEDDPEWDEQILANWLEEGFDYGLEEGPLTKVCTSVLDMSKKTVEI